MVAAQTLQTSLIFIISPKKTIWTGKDGEFGLLLCGQIVRNHRTGRRPQNSRLCLQHVRTKDFESPFITILGSTFVRRAVLKRDAVPYNSQNSERVYSIRTFNTTLTQLRVPRATSLVPVFRVSCLLTVNIHIWVVFVQKNHENKWNIQKPNRIFIISQLYFLFIK